MKYLALTLALISSNVFAADFCSNNKAEFDIGLQQILQMTKDGVSVKEAECNRDTIIYNMVVEKTSDNKTKQQIFQAVQQLSPTLLRTLFCSVKPIKQYNQEGLNRIVYIYSQPDGSEITRLDIPLGQCM